MQTQPKNAKKSLNQEGKENLKPFYLTVCAPRKFLMKRKESMIGARSRFS